MNKYKFSIHLPVYNKGQFLHECIESILLQTFNDFEVICVDDCSSDNSWEILNEYASKDKRFKIFKNKKNLGTLQTRKRCFVEASGEYMAFIDADDHAAPTLLEKTYFKAMETNADFIQFAATIDNEFGTINENSYAKYNNYYSSITETTIEGSNIFRSLSNPIRKNFWISAVSKKIYKSIIPYIPECRLQHGNDNLLIFMMTFFAKKYVSFNEILYFYRANILSSNLIDTISPEMASEHIVSRSKLLHYSEAFLKEVAPKLNHKKSSLPLLFTSTAEYTATLVKRCLLDHNDETERLSLLFVERFGELTPPGIYELCKKSSDLYYSKYPLMKTYRNNGNEESVLKYKVFKFKFLNLLNIKLLFKRYKIIKKSKLFSKYYYKETTKNSWISQKFPLLHYICFGCENGYKPNPYFDPVWYLKQNSDVREKGIPPLLHYICSGWQECRSPSEKFSISKYYISRPDIKYANIEPLQHFLTSNNIDEMYLASNPINLRHQFLIPDTKPIYKLSTVAELQEWHAKYTDFMAFRAKMCCYATEHFLYSNLKLIQDLAICNFIKTNIPKGAKILEIGGGTSRILEYFKDDYECWGLDKFEGVGNGPTCVPDNTSYKLVENYIGAFDENLLDNYFDMVFSISVFEHINEDNYTHQKIIDDIERILKPNGFNVHCMDCRFSSTTPDMRARKFIKYITQFYGFSEQYVIDNYNNPKVFKMSEQAYDKYWKPYCQNRSAKLDGLPVNIFMAVQNKIFTGIDLMNNCSEKSDKSEYNPVRCNICNSNEFTPAWGGRLKNNIMPQCAKCKSCERHRIINTVYKSLPIEWSTKAKALQFSNDYSIPRDSFEKFEISNYYGENHLDMEAIDRNSGVYDWCICNHVLEHVENDSEAMLEMLRVIKKSGLVLLSVPSPLHCKESTDWGFANPKICGHYRTYGEDLFTTRFKDCFNNDIWHVFSMTAVDPVTRSDDICYLVTKDKSKIQFLSDSKHWKKVNL